MKLIGAPDQQGRQRSHPTRVRGLKPELPAQTVEHLCVAPHAGAWIETLALSKNARSLAVAPHAGAWIET